jgi:hypothetical protein
MLKVLAFTAALTALGAAAPIGAGPLWEAEDQSLVMTVPGDAEEDMLNLQGEPDRFLLPFLAMIGAPDADAEVTEQGLSSVTEDVSVERVTVNGETCYRTVKRRSEVLLDFMGVLSRTESEEYGQAFNVANDRPCDLPPSGLSSVSLLPGTWRMTGVASE